MRDTPEIIYFSELEPDFTIDPIESDFPIIGKPPSLLEFLVHELKTIKHLLAVLNIEITEEGVEIARRWITDSYINHNNIRFPLLREYVLRSKNSQIKETFTEFREGLKTFGIILPNFALSIFTLQPIKSYKPSA